MRPSTRALITALLASLVSALLVAVPASPAEAARGDVLVQRHDARGDVRFTRSRGLGPKARRAIDIRWAKVTQAGPRTYRFTVKLKKVAPPGTRWDQMVHFHARPKNPRLANRHYAAVGFAHHRRRGMTAGYAYDAKADTWCDITRVQRRPAKKTLSVLVPLRCMPWGGWIVDVSTSTGRFRTDMPSYSSDKRRLGRLWYP